MKNIGIAFLRIILLIGCIAILYWIWLNFLWILGLRIDYIPEVTFFNRCRTLDDQQVELSMMRIIEDISYIVAVSFLSEIIERKTEKMLSKNSAMTSKIGRLIWKSFRWLLIIGSLLLIVENIRSFIYYLCIFRQAP